jgi:hypothetical protein
MAIEHNHEEPKRSQIEEFLKGKGYTKDHTWLQDDFYLPSPTKAAEFDPPIFGRISGPAEADSDQKRALTPSFPSKAAHF